MHLLFERECVFRICTGEGPRRVYAIVSFHFFDALANRFNHSGTIRSGCVGERWLRGIGAGAHVGVIRIDPCGMNAHQHLTGRRFWCGHLLKPQDLGTAEFMNPNRFHFSVSRLHRTIRSRRQRRQKLRWGTSLVRIPDRQIGLHNIL
jgi:hypothetical protein